LTPAGNRRNGTSKYGHIGASAGRHSGRHAGHPASEQTKLLTGYQTEDQADRPAGRRAGAARKPARRGMKAAPAVAVAATLVAGAATYVLTGPAQPSQAKLAAALSSPQVIDAFTRSGIAKTDAGASVLLSPHHATVAAHSAAARPAMKPAKSATATPAATQSAAPRSSQSQAPASPAATPSSSPSASSTPTASTVSCSDNSYLLPANVTSIVSFLLANGYSDNAAAGIAGNMYQESKGDPESVGMGGGGLIGFTPLPAGYVTGNPSADLQTQLNAVLTYNQIWASYIPELNSAASPADAAYIYVTDFERAGIPAASTREASADAVASACGI
jgi:Phage tail lysozyme